jgi:hypothetical protein
MRQYDFQAFLDRISDLNYFEMIREAEREASAIDAALSPGRGRKGIDKQYKGEAASYRNLQGGFLFFLRYGIKPGGVSDLDFLSFRPVIEKLVKKGQLKDTILSLFENTIT